MSKTFSQSDVASHNKSDNLWVVIDEDIYDLTKFQDEHPGEWPFFAYYIIAQRTKYSWIPRWKEDPHASRWQGCIEAILEIPQRRNTQEI
jgi:hypothetical protein